jgi:hypothetical protein
MTVRDNVQAVPRLFVSSYLTVLRLPLMVTRRIAKQRGNEKWPPALAFERFEAGVETLAGSLLRDQALTQTGRLRQAKVGQLRKAAELETLAGQEENQADERLEQRRKQVTEEREETQRRAEQRKRELERQAELHERKVEKKAEKRAAASRQAKAAEEKAIAREERAAKKQALDAEARAQDVTKEALKTEEKIELINQTIEGSTETRKTG